MNRTEIVSTFLEGFNDPTKLQASLDLLAEDYHFTNPVIETHSKVEFIELAKKIGAVVTGIQIIATADSPDWIATFYEFQTEIPGLERTDASEWFSVVDGKIKESYLVYDATNWRKLYGQM